ncbi:hypothetical protein NBRC3222_1513 [Acetobacter pasteurianus NBRC 3222]|nr:hypothetical protein NBRC3222_1513 [Acetobacter pasteurianus NBRC 3222]
MTRVVPVRDISGNAVIPAGVVAPDGLCYPLRADRVLEYQCRAFDCRYRGKSPCATGRVGDVILIKGDGNLFRGFSGSIVLKNATDDHGLSVIDDTLAAHDIAMSVCFSDHIITIGIATTGLALFHASLHTTMGLLCQLPVIIFLVNNRGYVIEIAIHDGPCNYIKNWDYADLMEVFNAEDGHGLSLKATTAGELAEAIKKAKANREGSTIIECQIERSDCTKTLVEWGKKVAAANSRKPQVS